MPRILLSDNGSKKPAATLQLRYLAAKLEQCSGQRVDAVSLQHADSIAVDQLDGEPARVLPEFLEQCLQQGEREFIMLPLFFGKSRALTSFVPDQQAALQGKYGPFKLALADVLYPLPAGEPMLVDVVMNNIQRAQQQNDFQPQSMVLVDHGSPAAHVTAVRQHIAEQLNLHFQADWSIEQAAMERRPGAEYDFNGPLLADWLDQQAQAGIKRVLVSLLFLLAGRHAGKGGDIESICAQAMDKHPGFEVQVTPLLGENDLLLDILQRRLETQLATA